MKALHIIILSCLLCLTPLVKAEKFPYHYLAPITISPSEDAACMFFDKEGVMWIGTNAGVKSYDGYQVKTYKSNAFWPGILPNNTIRSIAEDHQDNLWLGTRNGLVRMNKRTGTFKTFHLPDESQRIIYTLFVSKDGTLWIGTDGGLTYYQEKDETFHTYNEKNTWLIDANGDKKRMVSYSVKAIVEDKNGDLLIGTWSSGLLRLRRGGHELRRYPQLNAMNSAYSLFFDKQHRLWVGTWGYGILHIDNPDNVKSPQIHQYPYTTCHFDTFYKMVEDPVSQKLWASTREGVCYIDERDPDAKWQNFSQIGEFPLNLCHGIDTDGYGNIWLCTQDNGIMQLDTKPSPFQLYNLDTNKAQVIINYIYSIMTNDGEWFWLGLNPYGIALYNRKTGQTLYNQEIQGFGSLNPVYLTTSISKIQQRSNGEIWFANNNYGIIVKPQGGKAFLYNSHNCTFIVDNYVNTLFESRDKLMWIGQRSGLSVVYPDNKGFILTDMKDGNSNFTLCDIRHIFEDKKGNIWLSTDNEGIIRISGDRRKPKTWKYKQYNPTHHNFAIDDAIATLEDSKGRFWAISNSGGLFIYNKVEDRFEPKSRDYHLASDRVLAIQEDQQGDLWLTTDKALAHIVWGDKGNRPPKKEQENELTEHPKDIIYFTKEDGLGDLYFAANTACKYGQELFFGNQTSFFAFVPSPMLGQSNHLTANLIITDLKIDDQPFTQLDSASRADISKEMPAYTRRIILPSHIKKLGIEFSLLTYGHATKNIYAYKLKGYDNEWQYVNGETHSANYQNLPSGTYEFQLKATNSYGHWQKLPYTLTIKVLPPWYASRLAYMLYILLFIGAVFATARWYKERLKTKNRLQMGVILTNITHELLTPLTVISATIDKLKSMAPQYEDDYMIMDSNINRTTRLLRQILEVRKSQAGQLRLLVSRGNLSTFVKNACESIRPMAENKGLTLSVKAPDSEAMVWFDADKLDKILYNLLSNAIKYNKEKGNVSVELTIDKGIATISIADNGIGMSKEKMKKLYTRFFDGDYRKQKQPGTGIGLALTHDLVKLHHGNIQCESTEGQGTTFTISIPIKKSAFADSERDRSNVSKQVDKQVIKMATQEKENAKSDQKHLEANKPSIVIKKGMKRILVVEDNEELLDLMYQMLSQNFHVLTAKNGKQAMTIIMKEQLDLVVSDVMMPIMDGLELTKRIKTDKSFWQLPVILLTAKNSDKDKTDGYATGADAYITKPFKLEELEVRINTLISNQKKIREKIVREQILDESQVKDTPHYSDPNKAFVEKATEMVLKHLDDDGYDREAFAKDMVMGASTLYNKVKATTGQTIVSFMTTIRMREARKILQANPDILITDLASRVGFNTPKYFSKCFKKEFGMFPKDYSQQLKSSLDESKKAD